MWSAKDYIYLRIALFFLIALYMHIIYPEVELEAIAGRICTFQQTSSPRRVLRIPETERLMLRILLLSLY